MIISTVKNYIKYFKMKERKKDMEREMAMSHIM